MGITHFITTSEGKHISNPAYLKSTLPALRRQSRSVSRKKKGGANRRKAVKQLQKIHAKIANQRKDFNYKISLQLTTNHSVIAMESLNIKQMMGNRRMARLVNDVAWGNFQNTLKNKAEETGVTIIEIDPAYTSQMCSKCGHIAKSNRKSQSLFLCKHCFFTSNADVNASLNILSLARTEPLVVNTAVG